MENEICELRKTNEKILKERADYENAIQRALLKGVSSLNVEALKVLRVSPKITDRQEISPCKLVICLISFSFKKFKKKKICK